MSTASGAIHYANIVSYDKTYLPNTAIDPAKEAAPRPIRANKKAKKSGTLLATLRYIGGITLTDKRDVTGEDTKFIGGGYNLIFKGNAKQSLHGAIESGDLDDFLP